MNSLKNAVVIVILFGVAYGAYQIINEPEVVDQGELDDLFTGDADMPDIQFDEGVAQPESGSHGQYSQNPDSPPVEPEFNSMPTPNYPETGADLPPRGIGANDGKHAPPNLLGPTGPTDDQSPLAQLPANPGENLPKFSNGPVNPPPPAVVMGTQPDATLGNNGGGSFDPNPQSELEPMTPKVLDGSNSEVVDAGSSLETKIINANQIMNPNPAENATPAFIDWQEANRLATSKQHIECLRYLTRYYRKNLDDQQRDELLQWLDALAGKVIYSTEHFLDAPYIVRDNDTLESIAERWQVPPQLIYNVNRSKIGDPQNLVSGTELKAVRGPFRAEIDVNRNELTLFRFGLYAGRFPINVGSDAKFDQNELTVARKSDTGYEYRDALGQVIAAGAPNNPIGKFWMGLGEGLSIHTASNAAAGDNRGYISLQPEHIQDVYGILNQDSKVRVIR